MPSLGTRTIALRVAAAALFAIGLLVASRTLPEWATHETPSPSEAKARFDEIAALAGWEPVSASRQHSLRFSGTSDINVRGEASDQFGSKGLDWLEANGLGLLSVVEAEVTGPAGERGRLIVSTSMRGDVVAVEFTTSNFGDFVKPGKSDIDPEEHRAVAELLLQAGEALGPPERAPIGGQMIIVFPVEGSDPPQLITASEPPGMRLANRRPGTPGELRALYERMLTIPTILSRGLTTLLRFVIGVFFGALFIVLVVKRSIGLRTAMMLGSLVFFIGVAASIDQFHSGWMFWMRMVLVLLVAGWGIVVWSAAESWLRTVDAPLLGTLDALASFRPGPRSGTALVNGWFAGLGLAGLILLLEAVPATSGLLGKYPASLSLPIFGTLSPLARALFLSAGILAASAAAHYFAKRWETAIAISLTTIAIVPLLRMPHWSLTLVAAVAAAAVLRALLKSTGAAGVLAAVLNMIAAPAAIFALRHLDWIPYPALGAGALVVAPLAIGAASLRKPPEDETQQIVIPRFMRRISEERRVQYEMGLLAEMQLKMLPESAPRIEGWDIAGHSVIASEVGGDLYDYLEDEAGNLWIAIGDVSGHGYQCAIAQAMTKASLSSLVGATHTPSVLLEKIDKVLRRGGSARTFTSLGLAKLDPATGRVTLGNAGNPYPVHVTADGRVTEIEMPSLPLGMGPPRSYLDVELQLGPRDYLLFYSDGLVEVRNRNDEMLGFDKPAALVRMRRGQSAAEIVAGLEKAWRDHLGEDEVQDDTTIVVVRRM